MPVRLGTRLGGVLVACAVAALRPQLAAVEPQADTLVVYSAELESIIHPVSAEFMIETMDRADRDNAAVVVFALRTPGGLLESTRAIVSRMNRRWSAAWSCSEGGTAAADICAT